MKAKIEILLDHPADAGQALTMLKQKIVYVIPQMNEVEKIKVVQCKKSSFDSPAMFDAYVTRKTVTHMPM